MKEKDKVILSAMLDGEASERDIQRILGQSHDAEIHAYWQSLVRQRDRQQVALEAWASIDLVADISASLDRDDQAGRGAARVSDLQGDSPDNSAQKPSRSGIWAPLAIAASVMFAVILGVETWLDPATDGAAPTIASTPAPTASNDSLQVALSDAEYEARLQALLVKHAGTTLSPEGGVAPMARLTSYQASQK